MPTSGAAPEVSIIAEMITPALLLLASGSLIATVLARIGRVVEHVRKIGEACHGSDAELYASQRELLSILDRRGRMAETALICYYFAVVLFVLTCLLIGVDRFLEHRIYAAPVCTAMLGVATVLAGSWLMVAECRLAMRQLRSEVAAILDGPST